MSCASLSSDRKPKKNNMKKHFTILLLVVLTLNSFSQKNNGNKVNQKNNIFTKTIFKSRADELIYIREYLNYKLPLILVKKYPEQMKKVQYELISNGENPTLEEAAKKSLHFKNLYEPYMSLVVSENTTFKIVKEQLELNDKLDFDLSKNTKKIKSEKKEILEPENKTEKPIRKDTNDALKNILKNNKPETEINQIEAGVGNGTSYGNGTGKSHNEPYLLTGRKVLNKPIPEYNCNELGRVIIQIVVDRDGNVIEANLGKGSTTNAECLVSAAKEAALKTKWNKDENAFERHIGKITYNFELK
jgi:hypothetical protein